MELLIGGSSIRKFEGHSSRNEFKYALVMNRPKSSTEPLVGTGKEVVKKTAQPSIQPMTLVASLVPTESTISGMFSILYKPSMPQSNYLWRKDRTEFRSNFLTSGGTSSIVPTTRPSTFIRNWNWPM